MIDKKSDLYINLLNNMTNKCFDIDSRSIIVVDIYYVYNDALIEILLLDKNTFNIEFNNSIKKLKELSHKIVLNIPNTNLAIIKDLSLDKYELEHYQTRLLINFNANYDYFDSIHTSSILTTLIKYIIKILLENKAMRDDTIKIVNEFGIDINDYINAVYDIKNVMNNHTFNYNFQLIILEMIEKLENKKTLEKFKILKSNDDIYKLQYISQLDNIEIEIKEINTIINININNIIYKNYINNILKNLIYEIFNQF